ncbi:MAG: sugar phosphate isomerase/epimerase [Anaerolineae bacterium]|nr:sugar phosphate isomerase/epimerase [Anaerolineae bacterium]MDW8172694.1 TIM barrel protein [Anaerolineae bacterium]
MTTLGLGSYGLAWAIGVGGYPAPPTPLNVQTFLRRAHELGLRLVQIADNLPLHVLSPQERADLRTEADQLGIAIEVGTRGILPQHLELYLAIAQEFRSPILRVVVDTPTHHPQPAEVVEQLRLYLPRLEQMDITLAIENHDRFKAHILASIIQALDHPRVGICLDTVNSFGALEGPQVVVETLGPYVVNLHVKEFTVQRMPHNMGFIISGAPAGQGMLDIPWLLQCLSAYGRPFNAIIETWLSPLETMEATVEQEWDYVRQSVRFLRTLIQD